MKRVFALTAVLLICAATAHAQGISGGIRAGANFANLSFSSETEVSDAKNLTGLVAGVFATVPVNDVFAFQPELLFSMQGTRFSEQGQTAKIKLDYVQVPLLARVKLSKTSPVAVLVGPAFGFRSRAKIEVPGAPAEFSDGFADEIKKADVGLVTGLGADVGRVVLDGRYTWGLVNIAKDTPNNDPGTARHRVFSASVGVRF